ncbi:hypothetical protein RBWH47_06009 [Rhodopirellula baltica WH47]|uniref:Uncharacterized protein n=1 Tax=Rhodopirellula baltica WH47 TaxID=991778 RepID=F2AWU5_RHOBT|nr:hypothetical protein RBWH47_06009 [Rhodopirellula baltica WH47]
MPPEHHAEHPPATIETALIASDPDKHPLAIANSGLNQRTQGEIKRH